MNFLTLSKDIHVFAKESEMNGGEAFVSRIKAVGEESVFISQPYKKDRYWEGMQAEVGKVIGVRVPAERCAYVFEARLLGIDEDSEIWELSVPANLRRIQRRQHVRLAINVEVNIKFVNIDMPPITAVTKDISAGGLQIVLTESLPETAYVQVLLPLNKEFTVEAKGEIVRVTRLESVRKRFAAAIRFRELGYDKQDRIIKYIFHKEVEQRAKEKDNPEPQGRQR